MKKVLLFCGCIVLALVAVAGVKYFGTPGGKVISVMVNMVGVDSVDELTSEAELIVIGTPEKALSSSKSVITYKGLGLFDTFYTVRNFKIERVLKGNKELDSVEITEPAALIRAHLLKFQKDIFALADYTPMEKGMRYMLFLKENSDWGYTIMGVHQGKFNLDGQDELEKKAVKKNRYYQYLKVTTLEAYKDEISSVVSAIE
ncbi:hypothetical protein DFR58_11693 [Anaerobacterium chartisolvens]|uniref:Uncharacterized protein n=1 Tax=Anaerobacterium chartisolvens TaxID=1297424 RepID=A0A369B097_9FIRM|nr:hypothetical protein [Anaerobacterium chartisolvens]RCX13857.1 hypothetical protein DFR58_11693 [Anaerobacterium chartisolvens]